jgi:hypothetical protein
MILIIPSLLITSYPADGDDKDKSSQQRAISFSTVSYDGLKLKVRETSKEDVDFLKLNEGIASQNSNYNSLINGSGTGLRPPTANEWSEVASSFQIIDDISFASPTALNTSKFHNQSKYFPPIGNQGAEGSCVSWSIGYYTKTWQEAKEHDWNLSGATMVGTWPGYPSSGYQDKIMSPDFVYHQTNDGKDTGSYYRDAIYLTQSTGICTWEEMPYDCYNHSSWPSEDAWREAPLYRSEENSTYYMYTQTNATITDLKTWIDGGNLATISINANRYSSLVNETWNNTVNCGTGRNHANTIIGYDDNFGPYPEDGTTRTGAFLVANSWGKGWGGDTNSDGLYWISYECMRLKVQYVYLMADRIDYEPKALAVFNISHNIRDECTITLGIGPRSSPLTTKEMFDNAFFDGGAHPFPPNMIAYDITEFSSSVASFDGRNFFLKVDDAGTSATGSIEDFSIELFDNYTLGATKRFASDDPEVNTTQSGTVYAEVVATDSIPPRFIEDQTNDNATTGDPLTFTIVIEDNGLMDKVYVEYWNGTGPVTNTSMTHGTGNSWSHIITTPDTLENLTYRFHANDTGNNWNETTQKDIRMFDNDAPIIIPTIPSTATTGDPFDVDVQVTDNIDIDSVVLEHWHDQGGHTNSTMIWSSGENWTKTLTIEDRLGTLHLILKAEDTSSNQIATSRYDISISDNDLPTFIEDLSDTATTTGDGLLLSVKIDDNIGISSAYAEYSNGVGFSGNSSMVYVSTNTWEVTLSAPDSTSDISYAFHFNDTSDNWNETNSDTVTVTDNDAPTFGSDSSPPSGTTGDPYNFQVSILDNILVQNVYLEYWFGTGSPQNVSMAGSGLYTYQIVIPGDSTDTLHYVIHAVDTSSNWNETSQSDISIIDNDLPSQWVDSSYNSAATGDGFIFDLGVSDNIGIGSVYVEYWFGTGAHNNFSMGGTGPFSYTITIPLDSTDALHYIFHAMDTSNNWNQTTQTDVIVTDNDRPSTWSDSTLDTATTGDAFTFDLTVEDNIGIGSVHVEYWFGIGSHENISMVGAGPYSLEIVVPLNSIEALHYIFHAKDTSDNWNRTTQNDVAVLDNDLPGQWFDGSLIQATTGDSYPFNITVSDNIGLRSVHVEYWFGEGGHMNDTMLPSAGSYMLSIVIPQDSLDTLHYVYYARDTSNNWNSTSQTDVVVEDNDIPIFGTDTTPGNGYTGDMFSFTVDVSDNIGVDSVYVEYWYGDGVHELVEMSGSGFYYYTINIPADSNETLHYLFNASDTSDNWMRTTQQDVEISDNDKPDFYDDTSNLSATTGDEFEIRVRVTDNLGIEEVWLEYWFEDGEHLNVSMSGDENFTFTIVIPGDSVAELAYMIRFCDGSGNWNRTHIRNITIMDNDEPIFGPMEIPYHLDTGEYHDVVVSISDNIGVKEAMVEFWFGEDGTHEEVMMSKDNSPWAVSIAIPIDSTEQLHYVIKALDVSGLWNITDTIIIDIVDNLEPLVTPEDDITCYVGDELAVQIEATDNIGIASITWEGAPVAVEGNSLDIVPEEAGIYEVTVMVFDHQGNSAGIEFIITVLSLDHDTDEDGIPDKVEEENDLDKNDSIDADMDNDNDGLTNLEEYTHGTMMDSDDTDNDGMPDKWEVDHGLDALTFSRTNDEDGDGMTDLEEFTGGTDPLISDITDTKDDLLIPILILVGIVVAIILALGIFFIVTIIKRKKIQARKEEVMKWD